jgi:TatD DNase family protein
MLRQLHWQCNAILGSILRHHEMSMRLYDAHNHLQDARLAPHRESILAAVQREGIVCMVVNGSCEEDWPEVLALARLGNTQVAADGSRRTISEPKMAPTHVGGYARVLPSFGYHPWYAKERSPDWQAALLRHLDAVPSAIGEIGLDRWIKEHDDAAQEEVFVWQLRLAAERNLPVSIHCLQAWGRLLELLQAGPCPRCGFLLHSFGGPREMIARLAELGAYFSMPGYFAHERKARQRETFRHVPPDRLLIETDAPDQLLPSERVQYPLTDAATGKAINHPANLGAVYRFAAELLGEPVEALAERVGENFRRLFGALAAGS